MWRRVALNHNLGQPPYDFGSVIVSRTRNFNSKTVSLNREFSYVVRCQSASSDTNKMTLPQQTRKQPPFLHISRNLASIVSKQSWPSNEFRCEIIVTVEII
ncbi:hypothetical protein CQ054_10690 [Ochrobactrum sp. MYb29]|nr:hypothetical protein CQ054_10690 [Ochrobactrum sp. MYb29]